MKILLTGVAGFIGFHLAKRLLELNHEIVGIDNLNDYYDLNLKKHRLIELGVADILQHKSVTYSNFSFIQMDLNERVKLEKLFATNHFDVVCNLAAQPGVRYSISNPQVYMDSNVTGFFNLIKLANEHKVTLFVYASSSSVYGNSKDVPFKIDADTNHPVSFYAATKKVNELIAHTYSHIFNLKTIGIRFFTVYGPWGRPDMAYFSFTKNILHNIPITLFNDGKLQRDFTYVDDIVSGVVAIIESGNKVDTNYKIYNIGNHDLVSLDRFVKAIEHALGKKAIIQYLPMQPGDVEMTYADITDIQKDYGFSPNTSIEEGIKKFVAWYKNYYKA